MTPLDGYTAPGVLSNGDEFLHRPYTAADREALRQTLPLVPASIEHKFITGIIRERIVTASWECDIAEFPDDLAEELMRIVMGVGNDEQEVADEKNLFDGVSLATKAPWLVNVHCSSCRHWWFDPLKGTTAKRDGQPLKRIPGTPLLCDEGQCPKGHWSNPVELSPKNQLAVRWCETRPPSDDPIDCRNRRVIAEAKNSKNADQSPLRQI